MLLGEGISSKDIQLADSQIIVLVGIVLLFVFILILFIINSLLKNNQFNIFSIFLSYIAIGIGIPTFQVGRIISLFFIFIFINSHLKQNQIRI